MPDRLAIYRNDPQTYDLLISREDYEGNLLKALQSIVSFNNVDIADLGAGTGRISAILSPFIRSTFLTDDAEPILNFAAKKLQSLLFKNFTTHVSDIGVIPVVDPSFDVTLAGWSLISKAIRGNPWQDAVRSGLQEMKRVTRPGGTIILIESLGTGQEHPSPPTQRFADYFELLEHQEGFQNISIRTDYKFSSLTEKDQLLKFFFDTEMLEAGVKDDSCIYPECTGIWWKRI